MDSSATFSAEGQQLVRDLQAAAAVQPITGDKVHVTGIGSGIYKAYEKLRNAAEYGEQHLLLRAAIERFLRRMALVQSSSDKLGNDLVTELTQAGYLPDGSIPVITVEHVDTYIQQYANLARSLEAMPEVPGTTARRWVLQVLSSSLEKLLVPNPRADVFIEFANRHYTAAIDRQDFPGASDQQFADCLYVAVHRALLKSDIAVVRYHVVARGAQGGFSASTFAALCRTVDEQFQSKLANQLTRLISRNGAPMRILREIIVSGSTDPAALLTNHPNLLMVVRSVAEQQYSAAQKRLLNGVARALAFIVISKVLIGLAIEVPYDLARSGTVAFLPLAVNLLFPALYMASARWEIVKPGIQNTEMLANYAERIVYQTNARLYYRVPRHTQSRRQQAIFNLIYGLLFVLSFGLVIYVLSLLHFTAVHIIIFFVFFSAVSFLRFRLLQAAKELELLDTRQSFIATVADLFYTPFVRLGMWLSDRYKQVNVMTIILDFAIELPLKTSLGLLGQWVSFARDKRDEL
ncbi:MAG TPA: hypothetical protein VNG90_05705 [Candidatus Acidoferrum sp.]|nr:hypothetical protein [Candidatus Acidoferrum sp.]